MSDEKASTGKPGRPRAQLPPELIAAIGEPPSDPLERGAWAQAAAAHLFVATARGEVTRELGDALRASLALIVRSVPADAAAALRRDLKRRDESVKQDTAGPAVEAANGKPGVRHSTR